MPFELFTITEEVITPPCLFGRGWARTPFLAPISTSPNLDLWKAPLPSLTARRRLSQRRTSAPLRRGTDRLELFNWRARSGALRRRSTDTFKITRQSGDDYNDPYRVRAGLLRS